MATRSLAGLGFVGLAALLAACSASSTDASVAPLQPSLETEAKGGTQAPMLNLSHIECLEDGTVNAHFVLLFWGSSNPGPLSGTYLDGDGVEHSFSGILS